MRRAWLGQVPLVRAPRLGSATYAHLCRDAQTGLYKKFVECKLVASGTASELNIVIEPPLCVNGVPNACPEASQPAPSASTTPEGSGGAGTTQGQAPAGTTGTQQGAPVQGQAPAGATGTPQGAPAQGPGGAAGTPGAIPTQNTVPASQQGSPIPGQSSPAIQVQPTPAYGQGGAPAGAIPTSPFSQGQFTAMPGLPQSMFAQCPIVGGVEIPGWTTVMRLD